MGEGFPLSLPRPDAKQACYMPSPHIQLLRQTPVRQKPAQERGVPNALPAGVVYALGRSGGGGCAPLSH